MAKAGKPRKQGKRSRRQGRRARRNQRRQAKNRRRRQPYRRNVLQCQQQFLTSWAWKLAHRAAGPFSASRWRLMPLVMVAMLTMWMTAETVKERFEDARLFWTRMMPNRKRVGETARGFQQAMGRLRRRSLLAMQPAVRQRIAQILQDRWFCRGWVPLGVDGGRMELPRYEDLERRFGSAGKGQIPQVWVTSLVHLATGVPWSWRFGRGDASERDHLLALLSTFPPNALLVADAGFGGYRVWARLCQENQPFLIRLTSQQHFYADYGMQADFREGMAYFWPLGRRGRDKPLRLRLIRLAGKEKDGSGRRHDVWLATNVLDPHRLSDKDARQFFRMRWEQETFYRSYKRTLGQAKLSSRSVRQVVREVEIAMLGTQLLLAQAAWAVLRSGSTLLASAAEAVRQVRRELKDLLDRGRLRPGYLKRLAAATREDRPNRSSPKQKRPWPQRSPHRPPEPPKIHQLTPGLKQKIDIWLHAA